MKLRGLYVVTDPASTELLGAVSDAIDGGARTIQYRDKRTHVDARRQQAEQLCAICRDRGVTFIINDDPELAVEVDADGVHIGRDDPDLEAARRVVGPERIIGVSCYNDLDCAIRAEQRGADYVAFGSFFPSVTKPHAVCAGIGLVRRARAQLRLPIVAIGGITPENGAPLLQAGADALAVTAAVFGARDRRRAARQLARLFDQRERTQ